jgi:hypothetical protein
MRDLEGVLQRWALDADALARNGEPDKAALLRRCVEQVRTAAPDWLEWVEEAEAMLHTGYGRDKIRAMFRLWAPRGHAKQIGRARRVYRMAVLPVRPLLADAAELGRRMATRGAA